MHLALEDEIVEIIIRIATGAVNAAEKAGHRGMAILKDGVTL